jgi:SAM-dependent methyltransferase
VSPGFKRDDLKMRYDVPVVYEDDWHAYSGEKTAAYIANYLSSFSPPSNWLLNAGAGIYAIGVNSWKEVSLDLFTLPIRNRQYACCASIEHLPFQAGAFGGIVCVGEVLAYCDPAATLTEFSRVLAPSGILIVDFGSTRSLRHWLKPPFGRAVDLIEDYYNGAPELTWVYDPKYIKSLLASFGFKIKARVGTHTWSALARRLGASATIAMFAQKHLDRVWLPATWADLTTIVAVRLAIGK